MKKSSRWPIGIAALYSLFALALIGFAIFSSFQRVDLVEQDYYSKGMNYQKEIDRAARSKSMADSIQIIVDSPQKRILLIFNRQRNLRPVSGVIEFFRPADASLDRKVSLDIAANSRQEIDISQFASGLWRMKVSWKQDDEDYLNEQMIVIP